MRYLGIVEKRHSGQIILNGCIDAITAEEDGQTSFEVFEIESVSIHVPAPFDHKRLAQIEALAGLSIHDHRATLEGLSH
jgi:hypothetical protein